MLADLHKFACLSLKEKAGAVAGVRGPGTAAFGNAFVAEAENTAVVTFVDSVDKVVAKTTLGEFSNATTVLATVHSFVTYFVGLLPSTTAARAAAVKVVHRLVDRQGADCYAVLLDSTTSSSDVGAILGSYMAERTRSIYKAIADLKKKDGVDIYSANFDISASDIFSKSEKAAFLIVKRLVAAAFDPLGPAPPTTTRGTQS